MSEIEHADQLTRAEFKKLLRQRKTQILIIGCAIVAGVVVGIIGSPTGGLIVALIALLLGVAIAYGIADDRSEEAFYDGYAESRGLMRTDRQLKQLTPLLRKGDKRRTDEMFSGLLGNEFQGSLALYTYTEETRDAKGNKHETTYPFTVVTIKMFEVGGHLGELVVEERSGFKVFEKLEDAFRGNLKRLRLESEALDSRFEIFTCEDQDPVWIRRLFSPSFIVWLTEHPMEDFAFEFGSGELCVYVPDHKESAAEFDRMIDAACELARKMNAEVA